LQTGGEAVRVMLALACTDGRYLVILSAATSR
jgi:hypothetical protein